jgi:HPt (histidine-containing phosphotransfer) domain-containing protein
MFAAQSAKLIATLAGLPKDSDKDSGKEAPTLAHTLKGSARAVGAFGVADAAARLEAVLADGDDPSHELAELGEAVALARAAIEAVLRRS